MESKLPPGHPVDTFMAEHKKILHFLELLEALTRKIKQAKDYNSVAAEMKQLKVIAQNLLAAEKHHAREEEILFPRLEHYGVVGPPAVMRDEHTELRANKKKLNELIDESKTMNIADFAGWLEVMVPSLTNLLSDHIYKEDNILYPEALSVIPEGEWKGIKEECDKIGYSTFTAI